ncbi:MAG: DUF3298 domain-containing protein [Leadbetterella sp.]|nr:DUF3298 domain-containing protein [Leadbetterella sp.]
MYKSIALCIGLVLFMQKCMSGGSVTERKAVLADSTSFYSISVEYPEENRDKEQAMRAFVMDRYQAKKEEWKVGGPVYEEERKVTRAFPDRAEIRYTFDMGFERFPADSLGTVSYLFTTYEYTGGANGNTFVNSYCFSKDKRQVKIEEILDFSAHKDIRLSRVLAERALSDTTLFFKDFVEPGLGLAYLKPDGVTLDKEKCQCDGFFFGSNFQNFVVEDRGLTFYFDKYTIAPGAAGITHITLSWEDLRPYLKKPLPF